MYTVSVKNVSPIGLIIRTNRYNPEPGLLDFGLYFSTTSNWSPTENSRLYPYIKGTHYLSSKQVMSACSIRHPGSPSVCEANRELLSQYGFPTVMTKKSLFGLKPNKDRVTPQPKPGSGVSYVAEDLLSTATYTDLDDEESSESEYAFPQVNEWEHGISSAVLNASKLVYEDPFLVIAGRFYADVREVVNPPEILIWPADVRHIQDQVKPNLFDWEKFGLKPPKNKIRFCEVSSKELQLEFLWKHTFWGHYLSERARQDAEMNKSSRAEKDSSKRKPLRMESITLKKRITRFFEGKHDPLWTPEMIKAIYGPEYKVRDHKTRSRRFIEMLKTVDGVFAQRYLAYPHERWTWLKYDTFILSMISELLCDEFIDGNVKREALQIPLRFEQLKAARKLFKRHSLGGTLETLLASEHLVPAWLNFMFPLWKHANLEEGPRRVYLFGLLSQTRGCGKPPHLVSLKSKEQFIVTVSSAPPPLSSLQRVMIGTTINEVIASLPDSVFTGLATKARISVTSASCMEHVQAEGGTVQAIQDLVRDGQHGVYTSIRDLHTGSVIGRENLDTLTPGEYIFWSCLDRVLTTDPQLSRDISVVVVDEPGKSRTVTKSSAYIKIVLDLVNKLCSEPLRKGFESSSSGMEASNHGWNLFKNFFTNSWRKLLFTPINRSAENFEGYRQITDTLKSVYAVSTDYKNATDYMRHDVAHIIGRAWMDRCGIPPVLKSLVEQVCYQPRKVFFHGSDCLSHLGEAVIGGKETLRTITLVRGVMMGDPLTKVVLHLLNICVRHTSYRIYHIDYMRKIFPDIAAEVCQDVNELRRKYLARISSMKNGAL